jgi:hypothetical protein
MNPWSCRYSVGILHIPRPLWREVKKQSYPCNRPWRPIGLWNVEGPTFSRKSAHRWRWDCQPQAPAALYPPGIFLVLISVRGWVDPRATVRLEGLGQLKKIHLIGTQTRDLPAFSIVPQPTTLPSAHFEWRDINPKFNCFTDFHTKQKQYPLICIKWA